MIIRVERPRRGGVRRASSFVAGFEPLEARAVPAVATQGLLVQLAGAATADVAATAAKAGAVMVTTGLPDVVGLVGDTIALRRAAGRLSVADGIGYVEPRQTYSIAATPNDPYYTSGMQWGLDGTNGVGAPKAWGVTTGTTRVTVAVVDTGVDYNHVDLYRNIWINQAEIPPSRRSALTDVDGDGLITFYDLNYAAADGSKPNQGPGKITDLNGDGRITGTDLLYGMSRDASGGDSGAGGWADGISNDGDAYVDDIIGWNFVNNTNNPMDDHGHGTHVAGIIGATGNDGVGLTGVDWRTQVMALKFLDASGNGYDSEAAAAVRYAAAHGARVANNSYGDAGPVSSTLASAISAAATAGTVFVAAAGNDGHDNDAIPFTPASSTSPNVIAVAAIASDGSLASFSNYGRTSVDVAAPGVDVLSTIPNNRYGYMSGTSMAAPFVAGSAALLLAANPGWTYAQVIGQLTSTAAPLASLLNRTVTGATINVGAAMPGQGPVNDPATATFVRSDATTKGNWIGSYGSQGYSLASTAASLPDGVSLSFAGASTYTWAPLTLDPRAPQSPLLGLTRAATTWYSPAGSFTATLDMGTQARAVSLYFLDWDGNNARALGVDVLDANTGAVLDSRSLASFRDGVYLTWNLSGKVTFRFTKTAGANAVVSGFFFGTTQAPPSGATASFLRSDATTHGNWIGAYGSQGYSLANTATSLPAGASLSLAGASTYTWAPLTLDPRAPQSPLLGLTRAATTWYSPAGSFAATVDTGSQSRAVSLYFLDWDTNNARALKVEVVDADSGSVLDSRSLASFRNGVYLTWSVSGRVTFRITKTAGDNAVVSGFFFD